MTSSKPSEYQQRILEILEKGRIHGGMTTAAIAWHMKAKTVGPVSSALRALQRRGLVADYYPSYDHSRWAVRRWCLIQPKEKSDDKA